MAWGFRGATRAAAVVQPLGHTTHPHALQAGAADRQAQRTAVNLKEVRPWNCPCKEARQQSENLCSHEHRKDFGHEAGSARMSASGFRL